MTASTPRSEATATINPARRFGSWLAGLPTKYRRVTSSATYIPQIDGMRFLAIIQVVLYHAMIRADRATSPETGVSEGWLAWFPNGTAGVELFFFISGYIIAYPFVAGHAPRLWDYFKRRIYRLEPPYIIVLIICFALLSISGHQPASDTAAAKADIGLGESLLASLFYLHGLVFGAHPKLNPPLWSLELEIQFYIIAPALIALYIVVKSLTLRLIVGAAITVLAIATQPYMIGPWGLNYIVFGHFYAFWLGIMISDVAARKPDAAPSATFCDVGLLLGMLLFVAGSMLFYKLPDSTLYSLNLAGRAVAILLIYYGAVHGRIGRQIFGAPWIALIGGACYSIYLTHVPVLQIVATVAYKIVPSASLPVAVAIAVLILIPAALFVGMIYYVVVERFFMRRNWPADVKAWWTRSAGPSQEPGK